MQSQESQNAPMPRKIMTSVADLCKNLATWLVILIIQIQQMMSACVYIKSINSSSEASI